MFRCTNIKLATILLHHLLSCRLDRNICSTPQNSVFPVAKFRLSRQNLWHLTVLQLKQCTCWWKSHRTVNSWQNALALFFHHFSSPPGVSLWTIFGNQRSPAIQRPMYIGWDPDFRLPSVSWGHRFREGLSSSNGSSTRSCTGAPGRCTGWSPKSSAARKLLKLL